MPRDLIAVTLVRLKVVAPTAPHAGWALRLSDSVDAPAIPMRACEVDAQIHHHEHALCWPVSALLLTAAQPVAYASLEWTITTVADGEVRGSVAAGALSPQQSVDLLDAWNPFSV